MRVVFHDGSGGPRLCGTRYIYFWNIHGLRDMPFFSTYSQLSKMVWQSNIYMVLLDKIAFFDLGNLHVNSAQKYKMSHLHHTKNTIESIKILKGT